MFEKIKDFLYSIDWGMIFSLLCCLFLLCVVICIALFPLFIYIRNENENKNIKYYDICYDLDYVNLSSITKSESDGSYFLIFGLYEKNDNSYIRYIFLSNNGYNNSYKINIIDIQVGSKDIVSFYYVENEEDEKLIIKVDDKGYIKNYFLYVKKEKVLEMAMNL